MFKQKTAYEMRIIDWSSVVCSSDLGGAAAEHDDLQPSPPDEHQTTVGVPQDGPTSEWSAYATASPVYNEPARLLKWSMSGSEGATVRLHLGEPGASEDHPFRGMRWGKENGQLLRAVVSTDRKSVV